MIVGFSGLRLPQGPRRGVRPARLPVDLAARALRPGVPRRAARRAADGLLPARRARPRGAAARHRGAARRTSTPAGRAAPSTPEGGGPARARPRPRRARATRSRRSSPSARPAGAVRLARGPRLARGGGAAGAGEARLVGRLRRASPASADRYARRRGRCGAWASPRRRVAARAATGTQLALPLELPAAPALRAARRLGRDDRRLRDDRADDAGRIRWSSCAPGSSRAETRDERGPRPHRARHARARSAASSSRASARAPPSGVVFMLLEDEHGTINLIVPPAVYERHRLSCAPSRWCSPRACSSAMRPAGGAINVLVRRLRRARAPERPVARGQGLLAARRARQRAPGADARGRAAAAAARRRRIPRRGAARHVLRPGPPALRPPGAATFRTPSAARAV